MTPTLALIILIPYFCLNVYLTSRIYEILTYKQLLKYYLFGAILFFKDFF